MKNNLLVLLFKILGTGCIACGSLFGYVGEEEHIYEKPIPVEEKVVYEETEEVIVQEEILPDVVDTNVVVDVLPVVEEVPVVEENVITGNKIIIPNLYENVLMKDVNGDHFYLNHGLDGNYNGIGVPYIDSRNDFTGRKTILYAHSSVNGNGPFQVLQNYHNNPNFYYQHPIIVISYQGVTYTYQIFSVYISIADNEESEGLEFYHRMNYNDDDWEETINWYKNNSEYDTGVLVNRNDKILILQTCSMDPNYYAKYYRYNQLTMAKLIEVS